MATKQIDVVIIGGGWTGVAAATELAKLGVEFQLLEADPARLGGRAYSFEYNPNGGSHELFWEHGAQYVGQDQTAIWQLIQEHCPDDLVDGYALRRPFRQQIMIVNAPTFLDEANDPDQLAIDLGGLAGFPKPALLTKGPLSPPMFAPIVDQIATAMRAADLHVFPTAGHIPHVTHPEDYVAAIRGFIGAQAM